jgi:16S rRNA (guanine1207-N2)-methyltransferase
MSSPSSGQEPPVTHDGSGGHYFSSGPTSASRPGTVRLDLPDRSLQLATDAGVFSPGRVDPGTKLLLMELPELTAAPVVDVGCGYGPIACTAALRHPGLEVVAVDVNPRARDLCAANAASLGVEVTVLDPTAASERLAVVGTIVSNPPIRIGKAALHELMATWLDRLAEDGAAYLVVHKNLGADSLARWMTQRGHRVERLRSRQGYRILRVTAG